MYNPLFNKPIIFYKFQNNIQPSINQASGILSISEHYIAQHSTSLLYYINFRAIYSIMFRLYLNTVQEVFDRLYSKQEAIKTPEAMDTPNNKIYEQKLLTDSFAIKLKGFQ